MKTTIRALASAAAAPLIPLIRLRPLASAAAALLSRSRFSIPDPRVSLILVGWRRVGVAPASYLFVVSHPEPKESEAKAASVELFEFDQPGYFRVPVRPAVRLVEVLCERYLLLLLRQG